MGRCSKRVKSSFLLWGLCKGILTLSFKKQDINFCFTFLPRERFQLKVFSKFSTQVTANSNWQKHLQQKIICLHTPTLRSFKQPHISFPAVFWLIFSRGGGTNRRWSWSSSRSRGQWGRRANQKWELCLYGCWTKNRGTPKMDGL